MEQVYGSGRGSNALERTVLVVDDSESSVTSLEIALGCIPGIRVAFASSATEAIRRLHHAGGAISAVITDIRMPGMDGFALIRHIRADSAYCAIPIVVVSGDNDPETPERIWRLGANAFFTKPFSPVAVRKTVETLLYGVQES